MGQPHTVEYFLLKNVILFSRLFNNLSAFLSVYMYKGLLSPS